MDPLEDVFRYHEETKHHFFRYARSLGYMDWANQPDPFRRFDGAAIVPLPILKPEEDPQPPAYGDLFHGSVEARPLTIRSLSRFLELALSITAWKQAGEVRWALRSNPSSGNLHPTEGYVLTGALAGVGREPALYHYLSKDHVLERRALGDREGWARLMRPFAPDAFLFGLSSIHWREAWKYGERAFRYCQHDLGHAMGAAAMAAAALGWRLTPLHGLADGQVATLLGLDRDEDFGQAEREEPACLCLVSPRRSREAAAQPVAVPLSFEGVEASTLATIWTSWAGQANRLSSDHPVDWEVIDVVARATRKTAVERILLEAGATDIGASAVPPADYPGHPSAAAIIHQRRSALAFDGKTGLAASAFFLMLARVMPLADRPVLNRPVPWDAVPWDPAIHLALFVHRVEGLTAGLYFLPRDPARLPALRAAMLDSFRWIAPEGCPASLPLFRLQEGDARRVAAQVSCGQEIAGDGAFSLGMIADFEGRLRRHGPWFYRRLFWEAGVVGQVLYLEAEAAGVRSTGIGCYFDDPVHQLLGLKGRAFQSLYHFTVGGAVEDPRLTTLPPYDAVPG